MCKSVFKTPSKMKSEEELFLKKFHLWLKITFKELYSGKSKQRILKQMKNKNCSYEYQVYNPLCQAAISHTERTCSIYIRVYM